MPNPKVEHKEMDWIKLSELELDPDNPRFGAKAGRFSNQAAILDYLVDNLGVDNLLPSLAINGYFAAEPLVVKPSPTKGIFRIVEGNRRLASCLILAGDPRARNQAKRTATMAPIAKGKWSVDTTVPARIFSLSEQKQMLPYLGVRHIVSAQPWDSYAKAKWVSEIVSQKTMTLDQIVEVIGDENRTIVRMLEGYHFINQLSDAGLFKSESSVRRGRGSNPEFPFSWVYTLLGYPSVRKYLGLPEENSKKRTPIPEGKLPYAAEIVGFLFGDRQRGANPAINDSRKIGALASVVANPTLRVLLKQGKSIAEIEEFSRPADEQIAGCLSIASENLSKALTLLTTGRIDAVMAKDLQEATVKARRLATEVSKKLETILQAENGTNAG